MLLIRSKLPNPIFNLMYLNLCWRSKSHKFIKLSQLSPTKRRMSKSLHLSIRKPTPWLSLTRLSFLNSPLKLQSSLRMWLLKQTLSNNRRRLLNCPFARKQLMMLILSWLISIQRSRLSKRAQALKLSHLFTLFLINPKSKSLQSTTLRINHAK